MKFSELDPTISALFPLRPLAPSLGDGDPEYAKLKSGGTRLPLGRDTEIRPPRINPVLSQLACQRVENG